MIKTHKKAALISFLVLLPWLIYLPAITGPYLYDDFYSVKDNTALRSLSNTRAFFTDPHTFSIDVTRPMYRPVLLLSYALNYSLTGESEVGLHMGNLLIHSINVLLVFIFFRRLRPRNGYLPAFAASIAFAGFAAFSEPACYISSRSASLAATWVLLGSIACVSYLNTKTRLWLVILAISSALGLLTKPNAAVFPALVILILMVAPRADANSREAAASQSWRTRLTLFGIPALITAAYLPLRSHLMGGLGPERLVRSIESNLYSQARACVYYLKIFFYPAGQSINHDWVASEKLSDPGVLISSMVIVAITVAAMLFIRRKTLPGMGILWFLISLLPESTLVPLNLIAADRRAYLPLVGICIVLGCIVSSLPRKHLKPVSVAIITLVLLQAALGASRAQEWSDTMQIWRSAVSQEPNSVLLRNIYGIIWLERGEHARALSEFNKAAGLDPNNHESRNNMGTMLMRLNKPNEAEAMFLEASRINPEYLSAINNLGRLYLTLGRFKDAEIQFNMALTIAPNSAMSYLNMGIAHHQLDELENAVRMYDKAIRLGPGSAVARLNAAIALKKLGRIEEASRHLKEFYSINKDPYLAGNAEKVFGPRR